MSLLSVFLPALSPYSTSVTNIAHTAVSNCQDRYHFTHLTLMFSYIVILFPRSSDHNLQYALGEGCSFLDAHWSGKLQHSIFYALSPLSSSSYQTYVPYLLFTWTLLLTQGRFSHLTFWEQIDYGYQHTSTKKILTAIPVVLCIFGCSEAHWAMKWMVINVVACLVSVLGKLPVMHKYRILGINKD